MPGPAIVPRASSEAAGGRVLAGSRYLAVAATLAWASPALAAGEGGFAEKVTLPWVLPFVGLLLSIAILPMVVGSWWHSNRNQLIVAMAWAAPVLAWLLWWTNDPALGHEATHSLLHSIEEYASFIALLGSLYVISGGILLTGDLEARPSVNTGFLAIGAVIANLIGTTGAAMLLIRPLLRTNSEREYVGHIPIFFIFLVANIGGALTPIGDPPLFLGYLRGVPFFWTLVHLFPIWVMPVGVLLGVFFLVDSWFYRKEDLPHIRRDIERYEPLAVHGLWNFLLLGGVIASVLFLSPQEGVRDFRHYFAREIAMALLAATSWFITPDRIKRANSFTFGPIVEVAALFIGIFITMVPATLLLQARGAELGVSQPWQYFWATGMLSSFLDNAPTYVTFAALGCGSVPACTSAEQLHTLVADPVGHEILAAISVGAVFMGANSYIGNGPNFMVRAIAEENGYRMPSFFGYMLIAVLVLWPIFALVTLVDLL